MRVASWWLAERKLCLSWLVEEVSWRERGICQVAMVMVCVASLRLVVCRRGGGPIDLANDLVVNVLVKLFVYFPWKLSLPSG